MLPAFGACVHASSCLTRDAPLQKYSLTTTPTASLTSHPIPPNHYDPTVVTEGMAKAIKIDQLLQHDPAVAAAVAASDFRHPRSRTPVFHKRDAIKRPPTQRPRILVHTSPISPVLSSSPESDRFSWELEKGELSSIRHRKRKSPVDEEAFPVANKASRLPRFSVNIFHSEPANAFPIPNEGVVPRMVKYCEH
jgi:hypothetical protein